MTSALTHEGRVAVVTGSGRGIGAAIAIALAQRGAKGACTDWQLPGATFTKIGTATIGVAGDVSDPAGWAAIAAAAETTFSGADIVMNNAARYPTHVSENLDLATWQAQAIQRFAESGDIVDPMLFLTPQDAGFMTGQALDVDGGQYRVG